MSFPPVTLPDDPRKALAEIAAYLRTVQRGPDRSVRDPVHYADGIIGQWQTPEWLDGLVDIALECDRLAVPPPTPKMTKGERALLIAGLPCVRDLEDAVTDSGSPCAECDLCGRTHFNGTGEYMEDGELDCYLRHAEQDPEKWIARDGQVSTGTFYGRRYVWGCQCDLFLRVASVLNNHRPAVLKWHHAITRGLEYDAKIEREALQHAERGLRRWDRADTGTVLKTDWKLMTLYRAPGSKFYQGGAETPKEETMSDFGPEQQMRLALHDKKKSGYFIAYLIAPDGTRHDSNPEPDEPVETTAPPV